MNAKRNESEKAYKNAEGYAVSGRRKCAFDAFVSAARLGNPKAMLAVAECYRYGFGVRRSKTLWLKWLLKSVAHGDTDAMVDLGNAYDQPKGIVKDPRRAEYYWRKAALRGSALASFNLALKAERRKEFKQARSWYLIAARRGDTDAQVNLAILYEKGLGGSTNRSSAVRWYKRAANGGSATAMFNLAGIYRSRGHLHCDEMSTHWLLKAAMKGDRQAMCNVGVALIEGLGTKRNIAEGKRWLQKSADLGDPIARQNLRRTD